MITMILLPLHSKQVQYWTSSTDHTLHLFCLLLTPSPHYNNSWFTLEWSRAEFDPLYSRISLMKRVTMHLSTCILGTTHSPQKVKLSYSKVKNKLPCNFYNSVLSRAYGQNRRATCMKAVAQSLSASLFIE